MKRSNPTLIRVRIFAAATLMIAAASGVQAASGTTVSPEVGVPLQAAQKLIREHQYKAAQAKISAAEKAGKLSPYEHYLVLRMRGSVAAQMGDYNTALKALGSVVDSSELPAGDRVPLLNELTRISYAAKRYPESIAYLKKYRAAGGSDAQTLALLPQSLYVTGHYAKAAVAMNQQIEALQKTGKHATQQQLQLLASCALKRDDHAAYLSALKQLVSYYPKKQYWLDLIVRTADQSSFSPRLDLDVYRLRMHTGTLDSASDYMEATQLALQQGYPGEAAQFMKQVYDSGVLGKGSATDIDRENRLKKLVEKKVASDKATLEASVKEAADSKSGNALLATGYDFVTYNEYQKGLELMEQGLAKGNLKSPDDAKLHLGYAQYLAGHRAKAQKSFKAVNGHDGSKEVASLWNIVSSHKAQGEEVASR